MGGKAQALAALTKTAKKKSRPNGPRFVSSCGSIREQLLAVFVVIGISHVWYIFVL